MKTNEVIIKQDNHRNGSKSRIRRIDKEDGSTYVIEIKYVDAENWKWYKSFGSYEWVEANYRMVTRGSS